MQELVQRPRFALLRMLHNGCEHVYQGAVPVDQHAFGHEKHASQPHKQRVPVQIHNHQYAICVQRMHSSGFLAHKQNCTRAQGSRQKPYSENSVTAPICMNTAASTATTATPTHTCTTSGCPATLGNRSRSISLLLCAAYRPSSAMNCSSVGSAAEVVAIVYASCTPSYQ